MAGLSPVKLLKEVGVSVILLAERVIRGCEEADVFLRLNDLMDLEEVVRIAEEHHRRNPVDGVLPRDEFAVEAAALIAQRLGLRGLLPENATAARDKLRMLERLSAAGVAIPRWRAVTSAEDAERAGDDIGWPVVLKPRRLASSVGVIRVDSLRRMRSAF